MAFIFDPNPNEGDKQTNPDTGVEYIYNDGAWRALGPKIEDQFDKLDERYVNRSGDTIHGQLAFDRGENSPANLLISPNISNSSTSIYALNNGALRLRSVVGDNPDDQSTTHFAMGKTGDSGGPETYIYHLQDPQEDNWGANKKYVDETAAEYLPLTGGKLTGPLKIEQSTITFKKTDETNQFKISTNTGDYFTNVYSYNSGGMRFRVAPDDTDSGYKTILSGSFDSHTVGGTTHPVQTNINWLKNPTQPHHASNKQYVDDAVRSIVAPSATRPPGLRFKYQSGTGNPSSGMFRWYNEGGRRLNISTTSQDFSWGTNMPRQDVNYSEGHTFTIWVVASDVWKMKTTGTINRVDLHSDRMYCFVSFNADLNGSLSDTASYYITIGGIF